MFDDKIRLQSLTYKTNYNRDTSKRKWENYKIKKELIKKKKTKTPQGRMLHNLRRGIMAASCTIWLEYRA